jgi:hypothetical protein
MSSHVEIDMNAIFSKDVVDALRTIIRTMKHEQKSRVSKKVNFDTFMRSEQDDSYFIRFSLKSNNLYYTAMKLDISSSGEISIKKIWTNMGLFKSETKTEYVKPENISVITDMIRDAWANFEISNYHKNRIISN